MVAIFLLASFTSSAQVTGTARTALAIVEDSRTHRPIVDVGADDFVVQEGTQSREILSVRAADYPVVLMIDTGGPAGDLALLQKAAKHFVERLGSERPVAIGTFGGSARMVAGFDAGRSEAIQQLDGLAATASGDSSVQQAARIAAGTLAPIGSLFSSIVILSTDPTGQRPAGDSPVSEGRDATASVIASGAMLHIVAIRSPQSTAPGTPNAIDVASLRALAEQTRGQFFTIYTAASYEAALGQIAARMASELMIEYLVPNQSKAADVRVGVRLPGARVRGLGVK